MFDMKLCVISLTIINVILCQFATNVAATSDNDQDLATWHRRTWNAAPSYWSPENRIPMTTASQDATKREDDAQEEEGRGKFKVKKKLKKLMLPLLLAYKLKFFTLIPVMIGGLLLLIGSTGLAGFFFALFAAVMGLKGGTVHY